MMHARLLRIEEKMMFKKGGKSKHESARLFLCGAHDDAFVGEQPAPQPQITCVRLLFLKRFKKNVPRNHRNGHRNPSSVVAESMCLSVVGFEMRFQITQGIYSGTATFADRSALLGRAHRNFFEHRGDHHFHVFAP
jgi:hypothetical protein